MKTNKNEQRRTKTNIREHSEKVRRFIQVFSGSVKEAAELAGIKYGYARQLMLKPDIVHAIASRNKTPQHTPEVKTALINREEIELNLSKLIRDEGIALVARLRAIDTYCKMNCLYSEKRVVEGGDKPIEVTATIKEVSMEERLKLLENEV